MSEWSKAKLKEVAKIVTGKTPSTSHKEYFGGEIPFVTPADLNNGILLETKTHLTHLGANQVYLVPENTVLVSCIGNLGKLAITSKDSCFNQQINGLIFNQDIILPRYGFYFAQTLQPQLDKASSSTTLPIVNKSRFSELEIQYPSLEEQHRIAAILDKADELRQKRQQVIEKLDELLQAAFIDMFGDITEYQRSTLKLKDVAEINPKQSIDNIPNSVAFLPMADVHIDELFAINSSERSYDDVKKGFTAFNKEDILIAKITPCFENGKISIADISTQYGFGSTEFHVVRVKQKLYLYAIATLLRQSWIRVAGENVMTGSGGQKRIPKSYIENLSIPLMPDQNVEKFNEVFNKILQLKKVNLAQKASMDELFQSLQNQAFHGTL